MVKYRNIVVYVLLFAWRKCLENLRYGTSGNYLFIGRQNDTTDDDDNNFNIKLLLLLLLPPPTCSVKTKYTDWLKLTCR